MKKFFWLFFFLFFGLYSSLWAYDTNLEPVLRSSPNSDLTEYILITHNNLEKSLSYLQTIQTRIENSNEEQTIKNIRLTHLSYLRAYAYLYHTSSSDKKKRERNLMARKNIQNVLTLSRPILEMHPQYSDLRRVVAVSMMLFVETGSLKGFFEYKKTALSLAMESIALDKNNPMARVTLNNFDSLAPKLIGADSARGLNLITIPVQNSWPAYQKFEFYVSQIHAFVKQRDKANARKAISMAKELFPNSWRFVKLEKKIL